MKEHHLETTASFANVESKESNPIIELAKECQFLSSSSSRKSRIVVGQLTSSNNSDLERLDVWKLPKWALTEEIEIDRYKCSREKQLGGAIFQKWQSILQTGMNKTEVELRNAGQEERALQEKRSVLINSLLKLLASTDFPGSSKDRYTRSGK